MVKILVLHVKLSLNFTQMPPLWKDKKKELNFG
jgi:hypothetical protein